MKKALSVGLAAVGLAVAGWSFTGSPLLAHGKDKAEWKQSQTDRMDHRLDRLKEKLGLTADQASKIRALFTDQQAKISAIREDTHKKLAAVLTPEQKEKFENLKKEHGSRHGQ